MNDRLLTIKDVAMILKISESTIRRLRAANKFPSPMVISSQTVRYRESDIQNYLRTNSNA